MKIVICGPPHSGKSCLREGLKKSIRTIPDAPYPYVITANPDGEGAWFQETMNRSPEEALRYKDEYKRALGGFSPKLVEMYASWVKNCPLPLTFVDIGGIPNDENKKICMDATHSIILYNDDTKVDEWREFCHDIGLNIIAEIYSDYHGEEDSTELKDGIFRGKIHHLERGEDVSCRYCVTALAEYLLKLTNTTNEMSQKSMAAYYINIDKCQNGDIILKLSFGEPAENDRIVRDAIKCLDELNISGGKIIRLNGPTTVPVGVAITHHLTHKFSYIGLCDPKLKKYVIVVAHGPEYKLGDLID